jgi:hypothetical protein
MKIIFLSLITKTKKKKLKKQTLKMIKYIKILKNTKNLKKMSKVITIIPTKAKILLNKKKFKTKKIKELKNSRI